MSQVVYDTIQRCPHDEENPYTQIHNDLIRDKSISPNCRMIIIFLLSNKNNWIIRIPKLYEEFKNYLGKDVVYRLINEAIEAGYMMRKEFTVNNLKRYQYFLSEKPKFKKCFLRPEFQDTGRQDTEIQDSKERTSKEKTKKERIYKELIIANPEPSGTSMPAGGNNNNFFKSLDICEDLSNSQKKLLMKYPESEVEKAVQYVYHPNTVVEGGPVGKIKLLQYFLKNPENFKEKLAELNEPDKTPKKSKKDKVLAPFERGKTYNQYEFLQDDIGVGFFKDGMRQPYSVRWDSLNFVNEFMEILTRCGLEGMLNIEENKKFAEKFKKQYGLTQLKINKWLCLNTETDKQYSYTLPTEVFQNALKEFLNE